MQKIPFLIGTSDKSLEKVVVSPDNKYMAFIGASGNIHIVSQITKQVAFSMRANTDLLTGTFATDSKSLYVAGGEF